MRAAHEHGPGSTPTGVGVPGGVQPGSEEALESVRAFEAEEHAREEMRLLREAHAELGRLEAEANSPAARAATALERLADAAERIVAVLEAPPRPS